jgi:VWFA-related protein
LVEDSVYRFVMKLRMGSFLAAWLLAAGVCAGQAPAKVGTGGGAANTLSVDARLVNVPVVVQDKKGGLVQNLTKDNFLLQVDGNPQTIRYFNIDRDLPLTLGLLVDTSMSQRDVIDEEEKASSAFLDDMLNGPADRDKAFVIQFAKSTELLQDTTSSKPKLQAALKLLDTPGSGGGAKNSDPDTGAGRQGRMRGVGTTLYDALFLSSDELMKKQKGRKALIILSDGVDFGSKESLVESIEAAQRSDSIVYAIYFKGTERPAERREGPGGGSRGGGYPGGRGGGYPGGGGGWPGSSGGRRGGQGGPAGRGGAAVDGKKILERMVDDTGGRLFEVSKKQTVADIYRQIGEELRAQYRLAFTPDEKTASAGYHRLDLTLTKSSPKDLFVRTRDGYYTGE